MSKGVNEITRGVRMDLASNSVGFALKLPVKERVQTNGDFFLSEQLVDGYQPLTSHWVQIGLHYMDTRIEPPTIQSVCTVVHFSDFTSRCKSMRPDDPSLTKHVEVYHPEVWRAL